MKVSGSFLLALTLALPAAAGEVYIPFLAADVPGMDSGRSTLPRVNLNNLGGVHRRYVVRFTPGGEDGRQCASWSRRSCSSRRARARRAAATGSRACSW